MLNFCSPPFFFVSAHGVKNLILVQKQRQISFSTCKPLILHTAWERPRAKLVGKKSFLLLMLSPLHLYWDLTSLFEHCLVDWFQQCDQGHELPLIPCDDNRESTFISWFHMYYTCITSYICCLYLWYLCAQCVVHHLWPLILLSLLHLLSTLWFVITINVWQYTLLPKACVSSKLLWREPGGHMVFMTAYILTWIMRNELP